MVKVILWVNLVQRIDFIKGKKREANRRPRDHPVIISNGKLLPSFCWRDKERRQYLQVFRIRVILWELNMMGLPRGFWSCGGDTTETRGRLFPASYPSVFFHWQRRPRVNRFRSRAGKDKQEVGLYTNLFVDIDKLIGRVWEYILHQQTRLHLSGGLRDFQTAPYLEQLVPLKRVYCWSGESRGSSGQADMVS